MSEKTNAAIARMANECKDHGHLVPIEEYLTSICTTDAVAEKIMQDGRSLQGAFDEMKAIARKRQVGGCAYIPPEEGFEIIRKYYGITDADLKAGPERKSSIVDITDLL